MLEGTPYLNDGNLCGAPSGQQLGFQWYCDRQCYKFCPTRQYVGVPVNADSCNTNDTGYTPNTGAPLPPFQCACGYGSEAYT
jgi:hypothetical protein